LGICVATEQENGYIICFPDEKLGWVRIIKGTKLIKIKKI
jgi:hypothetical protein